MSFHYELHKHRIDVRSKVIIRELPNELYELRVLCFDMIFLQFVFYYYLRKKIKGRAIDAIGEGSPERTF
jgi:hypothetical protein